MISQSQQLYIESIKTLYTQNKGASSLTFPITALVLLFVWSQTEPVTSVLCAWFVLLTAASIAGFFILRRVNLDSEIDFKQAKKLDTEMTIINIVLSLIWAFFYLYIELVNDRFAYMALVFLGASTIVCALVLSLNTKLYVSFMFSYFIAGFYTFATSVYWVEYLMIMFICCVYAYSIIRTSQKNFRTTFFLRHENAALLADIQEKKEAAEQANRAKTTFLAAASHDLRQPLQSITLLLAALSKYISEEKPSDILSKARDSVESLRQLLDSLLDISKLDANLIKVEPVLFSLSNYLQEESERYAILASNKGLAFHCQVQENIEMYSDPVLVQRVVTNLLENALNYTNAGHVSLSLEKTESGIVISISDTGIGISEQAQKHIFEEFYQVDNPERDRRKGLGLGLAIVNRLVELLEGSVSLKSSVNEGSCFQLSLRNLACTKIDSSPQVHAGNDGADLQTLHVLVIDDEIDVRTSMQLLLESLGCEVTTASDEQEAMERIDHNESGDFSLIIVDYRLRDKRTGLECLNSIRTRYSKDIPSIVITGESDAAVIKELEQSKQAYLLKPVSIPALLAFLENSSTN